MSVSKISIILFFSLINSFKIYSQDELNLFIKDKLGKPISYASVIWGKNLGLVSDSSGYLQIPDKNRIDSLIISATGYLIKNITKQSVIEKSTIDIELEQNIVKLPEVIVAKYTIENDFGCIETNWKTSHIKNGICSNIQSALLINAYKFPAKCKSISVFITKESSVEIPYRLRLYEIGKDGLPDKDLLFKDIIVTSYITNSWNTYDLDTLDIQLPENGFFAAVEWLCTDIRSENGLCVGLTNKMNKPATFYKYGNVGWFQLKYKMKISSDNIMIKVKIASVK